MAQEATPRVSIGLPVYNGERFLSESIESILAQEFTDFELLLVDNASTDASLEICEKYAAMDDRVSVHPSPENRGASWNFNRCVGLARGHYFRWAAHDDAIEPAFLRRCVEIMDTRPDVVLCYTQAVDVDEDGGLLRSYHPSRYGVEARASARLRSVIRSTSPCFEAFGLTRREQLLRTSRLGPYTSSDRVLFAELALMGQFYEVPEVLFRHRQHTGRSVVAYADDRQRNAWFDPARAGRHTFPKWRLLAEYGRAVTRAPIPPPERARAFTALPSWAFAHRRTLSRELASWTLQRLRVEPS